ncbi:MAG: topoisomerase DNA-binding C4 zinc finger domain-containing protein [bacterium]|nr:topoisomerase DNA-binding C4 zinc finger domain-containing protein [bacterium]
MDKNIEKCPKCGADLNPIEETPSGKKLQRCSKGTWNRETKQTEGCTFVKWMNADPVPLNEKCPKCGAQLVMSTTRNGKKLKKCIKGGWDKDAKKATGCDYVEWFNGTKEELDELCPQCEAKLLLVTTANGKRMKKCSTSGWDREKRKATGCTYVQWLPNNNGDENAPEFEA